MRILFLEDDPILGRTIADDLRREGFHCDLVGTLNEARTRLLRDPFDLLLLDVNIGSGTSFELAREAHERTPEVPIVFLTANTDEQTAVRGLSIGAVDFVRKPVGRQELILRLRKPFRGRQGKMTVAGMELDLDRRLCTFGAERLSLTPTELTLLSVLLSTPNVPVPRERLLSEVDPDGQMEEATLQSHLSRLRGKLARATSDRFMVSNVYGVGYQLSIRPPKE